MKKIVIFIALTIILSSCAVGTYMPNAYNNYGTQTQVVLDRANFRIVRDVEVVVEVNNINLKRTDVKRSAYGELLRQHKLTGSQAFINVSIEEVRRERRDLFGFPAEREQYVIARATIIEFLKDNGEPTSSVASPYAQTTSTTTEADIYYLAYLAKTKSLDFMKVDDKYDIKMIKKLATSSTKDELLERSKGHSKSVEKYAIK